MNYMEFNPYVTEERHQQMLREVNSLRLEKRLRKNHEVRGSQLTAFALRLKSTLHLFRKVGLTRR